MAETPAVAPTTVTLTPVELATLQAGLDDAWAYRLGDAYGIEDPDLDPDDARALRHLGALVTTHPVLDAGNGRYPEQDPTT